MPLVLILTKHFKNRFNQMIKYTLYPLRDFPVYLDRGYICEGGGGGVYSTGTGEAGSFVHNVHSGQSLN